MGFSSRRAMRQGFLLLCAAGVMLGVISLGWGGRAHKIEDAAVVIDGDSIEIAGRTRHLAGIDAPELGQQCMNAGKQWRCGLEAALTLQKLFEFGPIDCAPAGQPAAGPTIACAAKGKDLAEALLAQGYAVALPDADPGYIRAESAAKKAELGLWRGDFVQPAAWRDGQRLPGETSGLGECTVKGVIDSDNQRLYYVPSDEEYEALKIDPSRGERMFCSDDEAVLAGWMRHPTE